MISGKDVVMIFVELSAQFVEHRFMAYVACLTIFPVCGDVVDNLSVTSQSFVRIVIDGSTIMVGPVYEHLTRSIQCFNEQFRHCVDSPVIESGCFVI